MAEDTNEAKTISDDQFLEWLACWGNEGLTSLALVGGYARVLLEGRAGELTEEQHRFVEIIFRNCVRAAEWFRLPETYLAFRLGRHHVHWEEIRLPELISQAISRLQSGQVQVDLPDDLPPVRGCQCLQDAILYLIEPDLSLAPRSALQAQIRADKVGDSSILVQVRTGIHLDEIGGFSCCFFPGTRLSIADQIIRLHESQVKVQSVDKETEFRFTLPIWRMPPGVPRLVELTSSNNGDQVELMLGQDLVVHLSGILGGSLSWRVTKLDPQVMANGGYEAWGSDLRLRFRTIKTGQTSLRIEYNQTGSPEPGVFCVQIKVKPQIG